jgi:hypothetical protein
MSAQHTPGPWGQWISRRSAAKGKPRSVIRTYKGGALVCVIESGASDADRALITSAPELLQAIKQAQEALEHAKPMMAHYPEAVNRHVDAQRAVAAAIAKAEGANHG